MYRITLACSGVSPAEGPQVVADVLEEFGHRPWQQVIVCEWREQKVVLIAENDFDAKGEALADEFSDAIAANWNGGFSVSIISVAEVPGDAV